MTYITLLIIWIQTLTYLKDLLRKDEPYPFPFNYKKKDILLVFYKDSVICVGYMLIWMVFQNTWLYFFKPPFDNFDKISEFLVISCYLFAHLMLLWS